VSRFWRISLSLIGALLVVLLGYIPVGRAYAKHHAVTVDNGGTLEFSAAPGDRVLIGIHVDEQAVKGLWRTDTGVTLAVNDQKPVTLLAPNDTAWGDEITTDSKESTKDFVVPGTLTMPSTKGTLTGKLTGVITFPGETDGFQFRDATAELSVPVKITVTSAAGSGPGLLDTLSYLAMLLAIVLLCCAVFSCATRLDPYKGIQDVFISVFAAALGGGAILVLVGLVMWLSGTAPGFGAVPGLPFPVWTLPITIGFVAMIGAFAGLFGE
jgi:hypothetical protein